MKLPDLPEMIHNFAAAASLWAACGFPVVDWDTLALRKLRCDTCPEWSGFTCRKCGCTRLKIWLQTEKCPLKKW